MDFCSTNDTTVSQTPIAFLQVTTSSIGPSVSWLATSLPNLVGYHQ